LFFDKTQFISIFLSIYLFTALFNQEKEKFKLSFSNKTLGKIHLNSFLYSFDNLDIIGPPGNHNHIILATLSKASPAESSKVSQINFNLNKSFHK
jgi:hypothetical protein